MSEIVQLIEHVYDSRFSTDWLINLANECEFCFEYGCSSVNEFLRQQFLFGCDIRYEVVKHNVRSICEDASYAKLCIIWDFVSNCEYKLAVHSSSNSVVPCDDSVMDLYIEAAVKEGDVYRNLILVNLSDGKYIQTLI